MATQWGWRMATGNRTQCTFFGRDRNHKTALREMIFVCFELILMIKGLFINHTNNPFINLNFNKVCNVCGAENFEKMKRKWFFQMQETSTDFVFL